MGANLCTGGATFRIWAPLAQAVYVAFNQSPGTVYVKQDQGLLVQNGEYWTGFFPGVTEGTLYRCWIVGQGSEGYKRDPYAKELTYGTFPDYNCIVRDQSQYVWQDADYHPPAFNDLIVYQFHFGVYYAVDAQGNDIRPNRICKVLDVVDRIPYFAALGVNAIMPLPFQECQGENTLGYNGTDYFSLEMDYAVQLPDLPMYVDRVNALRTAKGKASLTAADLTRQEDLFKAFVDLCHLYGVAVIADVVFNHAGGPFDDQCMYFLDRQTVGDNNNSLYFTDQPLAGGLIFAFWKSQVCQLLIDCGKTLLQDFHIDGLRYDQVTVIAQNGGWYFAQNVTSTLRFVKPTAVQIAEYWDNDRWKGIATPPSGMGFDVGYADSLRQSIRSAVSQATGGQFAPVDMDQIHDALYVTYNADRRWGLLQQLENHDVEYVDHDDKQPRIAALSDPSNARSWYARSRSKVATGLLLTAPGIPMIFMGQEFLEDKYWSDWQGRPDLLIYWAGLDGADKNMGDQHQFTTDLMWLRRKQPALRAEGLNVFHVDNQNRVIAFQRWVPDVGRDVVVVACLNETTFYNDGYNLGFPGGGYWYEVFNSDFYDTMPNPNLQGNNGGISVGGPPMDGLPTSAAVTLPANSLIVFARDLGD